MKLRIKTVVSGSDLSLTTLRGQVRLSAGSVQHFLRVALSLSTVCQRYRVNYIIDCPGDIFRVINI